MNIVLILIDTLRYDHLGANGNDRVETPNLDRLAAESWCFDRAFCASFPTIPYRTDVMTGRYGGPFHVWKPLPFEARTLPWTLSEAGYVTQLIHDTPHLVNGGHNFDWPFHAWTFIRGAEVDRAWIDDEVQWPDNWARDPLFDCLDEGADQNRNVFTYARTNRGRTTLQDWNCHKLFRTAAQFLKDNARRENFFLWIDCFDPHEPWDSPPEFVLKYETTPGYDGRIDPRHFHYRNDERLSDAARNRIAAAYPAKVTWMDHCLGQFLDALESTGLSRNTAVILAGDHGTNVGERGKFGKGTPVREQEAHIPLLIRTPEGDTGRSSVLFQPQDFTATLLGLAGLKAPDDLDSHNVLALAREGRAGPRQLALSGPAADKWRPGHHFFTVFKDDFYLEWHPNPEDAHLTRLGTLDTVEKEHPETVRELHAAGLTELERRGPDPALVTWLKAGAQGRPPEDCPLYDGWPGPSGFQAYFHRIYTDTERRET